tara:strand:+ start:21361 stop:22683 length:1323 start_codon:yes stop_codon:yes gene_type:complete
MRTRFAPSPTGYLHIGGARTALFAWLYAKSNGGDCLLRIEDTDKERSENRYKEEIIRSFEWLGINFDEEIIYQSNNTERYKEVVDLLLQNDFAYVCEGSDLDSDKKSRDLKLARQDNMVVRFKMPEEGFTEFDDLVKGKIQFPNEQLDDFIVERSDGTATYNLCAVVDDLDSEISHVIRGDDHVNNTFKQINVFNALNAKVPVYGHIPMILGEDGKRLSKRHGAMGLREYAELGILPEALKNYFLRLGWSKGDDEIFNDKTMKSVFKDGSFNQSPATFSMEKLLWFNKYYLDQKNLKELTDLLKLPQFDGSVFSNKVLTILRDRCNSLKDFEILSSYFFEDPKGFDENLIKKHIKEETYQNLESLLNILVNLHEWNSNNINESIEKIISDLSIGFGKIGLPLRLALTSTVNSPSIDIVCEILGKETTIRRLEFFLSIIKD